ncbi:MAG: hypothetical protein KC468_34335 [Myxococcales bacterium]|nr:hypothetical protein [Myxococcales bacterium]
MIDGRSHDLVIPLVGDHASLCSLAVYTLAALSLDSVLDQASELTMESSNLHRVCRATKGGLLRLRSTRHGLLLVQGAFRLGARLLLRAESSSVGDSEVLRIPARLYTRAAEWRRGGPVVNIFRNAYVEAALLRDLELSPGLILDGVSTVGPEMDGSPGELLDTLWDMWACSDVEFDRRSAPPLCWLYIDEVAAERVWSRGSADHKKQYMALLLEDDRFPAPVARALSEADWEAWIELMLARGDSGAPGTPDAWRNVPSAIAVKIAADPRLDDVQHVPVIVALWTVIPARLLADVRDGDLGQMMKYCVCAPDDSLGELLSLVAGRLKDAAELDYELRARLARWLHAIVIERRTGWRQALKLRRRYLTGWLGLTPVTAGHSTGGA